MLTVVTMHESIRLPDRVTTQSARREAEPGRLKTERTRQAEAETGSPREPQARPLRAQRTPSAGPAVRRRVGRAEAAGRREGAAGATIRMTPWPGVTTRVLEPRKPHP